MKILLTGKNGQVGWELQRTLCALGDVVALNSAEMNLADPDEITRVVGRVRPGLIVNAAAYTAVDKAESEPDLAMAINGLAPSILAEEAKRLGIMLIHYSTDYVFDGSKSGAYAEDDIPAPLNVYGHSKLAGEQAITASGCRHLILRTSWVYGLRGKNFLLTMLRLLQEKQVLSVVSDQHGSPTWSRMIAEVTAILASRDAAANGIYHLTSAGGISWCEFAARIAAWLDANGRNAATIHPITSQEYPTPARRPLNSLLSSAKLESDFAVRIPDWARAFDMAAADLHL